MQDVDRCMPDNTYFRQQQTNAMMLDVLFIFCKLNPDISYRQGMHEILAPILWVIQCDAIQNGSHTASNDFMISQLCDPRFIEHDSFTLFSLVMQNAKQFYEQKAHRRKASLSTRPNSGRLENPILTIINRLFEDYLPRLDPELASHLRTVELVPSVFLMRWIRLLFGREFPFDDILPMWDVLFCRDPRLESVEMICLVMILRLRWELLEADHNEVLSTLLRYPDMPEGFKPRDLVDDALKLKKDFNCNCARDIVRKYTGKDFTPAINLPNPDDFAIADEMEGVHRTTSNSKSPKNLEKILQDAAKNVFTQSEKWGINKAFRDAVDEVKRGVRDIQSMPTPQPPRRHGRMQSRSSVSSVTRRTDTELRLGILQERNDRLAKLLKQATTELWEFQRQLADDKGADAAVVRDMSMSIARVGFVQVYLEDSTIPLPPDEPEPDEITNTEHRDGLEELSQSPSKDGSSTAVSSVSERPRPTTPQPPQTSNESAHLSVPTAAEPSAGVDPKDRATTTPSPRPTLAQSSFSWMLGQSDHRNSSPFMHSSPATSIHSARNRGLLFGDEDPSPEQADPHASAAPGTGGGTPTRKKRERKIVKVGAGRGAEREGAGEDVFDMSELKGGGAG